MSDGLFGMSRAELVDAVRALRDEPVEGSGLDRLRRLFERLVRGRRRDDASSDSGGPLAQARDDAVRHERLLTKYGEHVARLLRTLSPEPARTVLHPVARVLVSLEPTAEGGLVGRMPIVNDDRHPRCVTFESDSKVVVSPPTFSLGPREERVVRVEVQETSTVPTISILMDGRPSAVAQLLVDGAEPEAVGPSVSLPQPEDELDGVLRRGQLAIIEHPLAAQALFRAFVAEGRRFGETPDGRVWRERLEGSELAQRGRVVWEVVSQKVLEESSQTLLPTKLLDAFVKAVETEGLEPALTEELGFAFDDGDSEDTTTR